MYPLYNWALENPQWWITGFDPNWKNKVDCINGMDWPLMKENLIMIGSVDLSQFSDEAIDEIMEKVNDSNQDVIVDKNNKTIWIVFGNMIGSRV
ncbi:hypothetical protein [Ruminococcus albus]|uniref:Uncharacterized protein n=1 Tax=Ruminococcus albus (strain ATCC 27210 / DSM 20455 / JCM 14654 / NCDO 2250 / 7) TaxID=697329 RepID=E6UI34_RUMA7|nr:hypothetical protein [Ruminococcus albus]ADU21287.1 hypothetical protein Rumal_0749 [Ruminococcus albus 7 = DSM 20455]